MWALTEYAHAALARHKAGPQGLRALGSDCPSGNREVLSKKCKVLHVFCELFLKKCKVPHVFLRAFS